MYARALSALALLALPAAAQGPTFGDLERLFPRTANIHELAVGDLDGDTDQDVLILDHDGGLQVFLQAASGRFASAPGVAPGFLTGLAETIELFDADGDGDLDVYRGSLVQDSLFLNDGSGAFTDATHLLPVEDHGAEGAAAGDVDGDGDLDLYVVEHDAWLYRNDGAAGFTEVTGDDIPAKGFDVALVDLDGDGDLDALFADDGYCDPFSGCAATHAQAAFNDGTGSFTGEVYSFGTMWSNQVVTGDLDLDGDLDALFPALQTVPPALFRNEGGGTFSNLSSALPPVPEYGGGAAFVDVDDDGDLDVYLNASDNDDGSPLFELLLENTGGFTFSDASAQLPEDACCGAGPVVVGDLDADGDDDLVLAGEGLGNWARLYFNGGDGSLVDVTPLESAERAVTDAIALADLDGDGEIEGIRAIDRGLIPLENDGAGDLVAGAPLFLHPSDEFVDVDLGDMDGDGDLDIYGGVDNEPDVLLLDDGLGGWIDASAGIVDSTSSTTGILLADLDGDSDLDVFVSSYVYSFDDRLLVNDGSGGLSEDPSMPGANESHEAVAADFNLDGDLDVAIAARSGNRVILSDGAGGWTSLGNIGTQGWSVDAGDVDGDGDPDIAMGKHATTAISKTLAVYRGDGTGAFVEEEISAGPTGAEDVKLADLDGDGDLDFVAGGFHPTVWDNRGSFVDVSPIELRSQWSPAVAIADLDEDGDLDILFDGTQVLYNTERQAAWATPPALGRAFEIDVYSEASTPWALVWSVGTFQLPLPPYGVLKIDPFSMQISGGGVIGAGGATTYVSAIPDLPALAGLEIHWQAAVGAPLLLTNRTSAVLADL